MLHVQHLHVRLLGRHSSLLLLVRMPGSTYSNLSCSKDAYMHVVLMVMWLLLTMVV
jgi:hypothetical protein